MGSMWLRWPLARESLAQTLVVLNQMTTDASRPRYDSILGTIALKLRQICMLLLYSYSTVVKRVNTKISVIRPKASLADL